MRPTSCIASVAAGAGLLVLAFVVAFTVPPTGVVEAPIGTAAQQGNFGRFVSPEATAALKAYSNATDEASRKTALATIQKIFVEQAPMLPIGADNVGAAYSTKNWVGWPTEADSYAPSQPTQAAALQVVLKLQPANS